ncbi:peroxisomal biogenesis factor 6 [Grosmannia clavigera kw1407]|uniref:Peroxisomal biogenesis factor 6 n=1 Tax=Grosmannia clavigera (strain kw1407 / UAMH 11150) TaxID=655863 RepID=F0XH33_GROCL|nr:peroxisomal biogenesis factor 6 [Grosmannia clavigera kw1407]EFX02801.1 peroxisomal biogenesis factor 6 [Grosmannia clavigera kw1407]
MAASAAAPPDVVKSRGRGRGRRRRRQDKPAIAARLVLDDHANRGGGGYSSLSRALTSTATAAAAAANSSSSSPTSPQVYHVAIAPWAPQASAETTDWTVVPVAKSSALAHSTVQFSPASLALQSFAASLQQVAPSKLTAHSRRGIEILVLDVAAVPLDTVFVNLEGDLAKRLEDGEGTFFREHPAAPGIHAARAKNGSGAAPSAEDRLTAAVRVALSSLQVVHGGDLFPLPLPPHPITHVPPNPGKVTFCEPVAQGVLSPRTKLVPSRRRLPSKNGRNRGDLGPTTSRKLNGVITEDDGDETANDQFFSAAEERTRTETETDAPADDTEADSLSESELDMSPGEHDEDELSDDLMEDMISLQAPTLPPTMASGVSTLQPGSPTTIGRSRRTNGISTPGSVFSSFTATTARPDRPRGRLFKAQGLMAAIPTEPLHPTPASEDDEEARVYVDEAGEPPLKGFGRFALGSFGGPRAGNDGGNYDDEDEDEPDWRPVRVFGLPEGYAPRPVSRIPSSKHEGGRRLSFFESQIQRSSSPIAYASPILLANMHSTPYVRLSPLKGAQPLRHGRATTTAKQAAAAQPPFSQKVVIQQVRTPVPIQKSVQAAVVAGLKGHFEKKLRVVKTGDYIAIPIDAQLGRTMNDMLASTEAAAVGDILSLTGAGAGGKSRLKADEVAWFKVSHVQPQSGQTTTTTADEGNIWGSTVACVDIATAHLEQSGTTASRVPGTRDNNWPYYLGLRASMGGANGAAAVVEPIRGRVSPLRRQLGELMAAATSRRAQRLQMPAVAILLVSTQRQIGKATAVREACADMGLHAYTVDGYDMLHEAGAGAGGSDAKTEGVLKARAGLAMSCGPDCCALVIRHMEALTADRMVSSMREVLESARVVVATTTEPDKIPDGVRSLFTHEMEMRAPDETEREAILRGIVQERAIMLDPEVDLSSVALKTAALVAGDLVDVVERALVCRRARLEGVVGTAEGMAEGETTSATALSFGTSSWQAVRLLPNVAWDDVGGLDNVKDVVTETIQLPLERPELFARGMKKRSGILFYGPPGTGKTLLAKAIATEYSLNFFSSEANVRRVFQRARDARPCVVFFDELDSVAPKRGNQGDSGGVMDRIVSQLLAELDGMALLRPGRFDTMLYLGVSDTHEKQLRILEALTRKFTLDPTVSLRAVAQTLPFTYTGADFYALCSDAMLKAVTRSATQVDAKIAALSQKRAMPMSTAYYFDHYATAEDVAVVVTEQDFAEANQELVPSISAGELAHYERVRATFEGTRKKEPGDAAVPLQPAPQTSQTPQGRRPRSARGKGKGKAVAMEGDEEDEADDGTEGMTDGAGSGIDNGWTNGRTAKGKGKAVASFQEQHASDDEELTNVNWQNLVN